MDESLEILHRIDDVLEDHASELFRDAVDRLFAHSDWDEDTTDVFYDWLNLPALREWRHSYDCLLLEGWSEDDAFERATDAVRTFGTATDAVFALDDKDGFVGVHDAGDMSYRMHEVVAPYLFQVMVDEYEEDNYDYPHNSVWCYWEADQSALAQAVGPIHSPTRLDYENVNQTRREFIMGSRTGHIIFDDTVTTNDLTPTAGWIVVHPDPYQRGELRPRNIEDQEESDDVSDD